jgi:uncharacterized protein with HEPN domain
MTEKSKKYLSDILMAINLIREFTIEITAFNIIKIEKFKVPSKGNW